MSVSNVVWLPAFYYLQMNLIYVPLTIFCLFPFFMYYRLYFAFVFVFSPVFFAFLFTHNWGNQNNQ